jgi:hypothetical protein
MTTTEIPTDRPTSIELPSDWGKSRQDLALDLAENGLEDAPLRFTDRREVCGCCDGKGTTWHGWGRGDACSFTASEWAELDPDDQDGYMDGRYDGICPECNGANVVEIVTVHSTPEAIAEIQASIEAEWSLRAAEAQERRMGC